MTDNRIIAEALGLAEIPADRCRVCGWPLARSRNEGCARDGDLDDCSMRPLPKIRADAVPDFSTWSGFGLIMERGPGRGWFFNFLCYYGFFPQGGLETLKELIDLINPTKLRDTLSLWLKEHEGEWREKCKK